MVQNATVDNFDTLVLKSEHPVVVDFYADWCKPCISMMSVFDEVANERSPEIRMCKVNVENATSIANSYGVFSLPTIIKFENGDVVDMIKGVVSKDTLLAFTN